MNERQGPLNEGWAVYLRTRRPIPWAVSLKLGDDGADGQTMMGLMSREPSLCDKQVQDSGVLSMHMLYNSDNYAVVQIEMSPQPDEAMASSATPLTRGGYEIVDKFARKELFIEGAMAESFKEGVEALIETSPSTEEFDAYLERYAGMALQPVVMH